MSLITWRLPAAIVTGCVGFALGIGAGMGWMMYYGYHWEREPQGTAAPRMGGGGGAPDGGGGPAGGGKAKGKGNGGAGVGGGGGGFAGQRGPNPQTQLENLVTKLDELIEKPLKIELTPEQKKKASEQLQGLKDAPELSDEDAKKRLDALKEILDKNVETLETAGFRFGPPAAGGAVRTGAPSNPFKAGDAAKHLKSLETQLAKGAA